ncbi:multicopper oxidase family protein [Kineococcus aurantiacus]|uniref:FtsP/CotA-like multicopper oxidase with cupredoxin domain n=1 Tax=Kineococcus aurantiacus TaxID=37633 RepID=A0A7Y9DQR5_9ACTN|nr:FtsP/CotA-like multicopper oxidase with cupredoxin domain [Kineococcus aurantiacus]
MSPSEPTPPPGPDQPNQQRRPAVSRRALLTGAGAVALVGTSGALALARRGPRLPLDGPALPQLAELELTTGADGARTGLLSAGSTTTGLAYNGSAPGPLLRLREGERVRLSFHNDTGAHSSLHLHGLPLGPAADAPFAHLEPGTGDVREFTLPAGCAGTYWYHPHAHGDVERQLLAGLAGPVVVTGPLDQTPELAAADDRLLMLTRQGSALHANGVLHPVVHAQAGRVRLRLLNATAGDHLLIGLVRDGRRQPMHLIATDSGFTQRPVPLQEVLLAPGERAEVLIDTTRAGTVGVQALPYSVYGPGGATSEERTLAVLQVPAGLAPLPLPQQLLPLQRLDPAAAVRTRRLTLGADGHGAYTLDGHTFDPDRVDISAQLGTVEVWELVNEHTTDHPFHLHSYPFQVLQRAGTPEPFTAWRDTVNVPAASTVRIAVPLRGEAGRTVYHCHIASHEDLGMMGVLDVRDLREVRS